MRYIIRLHLFVLSLISTRLQIADRVLVEGDLDGDNMLSYAEFELLMVRAPEFADSFSIDF